MLGQIRIRLELRDPARNRYRDYELACSEDLFGFPLVDVRFGRAGTRGRARRILVGSRAQGVGLLVQRLRRRATAERRLGSPYRLVSFTVPDDLEAGLAPALRAFDRAPMV